MTAAGRWVDDASAVLLTDLYQLTMLQAYHDEGLEAEAVFDLFVRRLPPQRNALVAAGLDDALHYLETWRFEPWAIDHLAGLHRFTPAFLQRLATMRFTGDVRAVPEGTPVFAGEPLLEVVAPLPQAQLVETFLLNQVSFQTAVASKARRIAEAAAGRPVVEFGLRRLHGADAGMKAARAAFIGGVRQPSNVLAGRAWGIPVAGTMAHSYVEVHASEPEAFAAFAASYPDGVLLVDTYDTLAGVDSVIRLARSLGERFRVRAIRLDSGDLGRLARQARALLDEAGLRHVGILASGGLDEHAMAALVQGGAPIDAFGVGTRLGTSADQPYLDSVYKLAGYDGRPRMKLADGKATLPGPKQVFRVMDGAEAHHDVLALAGEDVRGEPLLVPVMAGGRRLEPAPPLDRVAAGADVAWARMPARVRRLDPAAPPYSVELSPGLAAQAQRLRDELAPPDQAGKSAQA